MTAQGVGVGGGFSCEWASKRASKFLIGNTVLSFMWLLVTYSAYMWNLSSVLRCSHFLRCLNICIVLWMVPSEWLCFVRCWANFYVWLSVRNACFCSLYLTVKFLPVWPTYALLHTGPVSMYIPDGVYVSVVCCLCISLLPIVLVVWNATRAGWQVLPPLK